MTVYILCKNEAANIGKCLDFLAKTNFKVVILDSGSTDQTQQIASRYNVQFQAFKYIDGCQARNEAIENCPDTHCAVIDADMEISAALAAEITANLNNAEVLLAPVKMYSDGHPLAFGSLYPDKPFVFKSGRKYFDPVGHGEVLKAEAQTLVLQHKLIHNDLKPYNVYIQSQLRYAELLVQRPDSELTMKDKIRMKTPLMILAVPFITFFVKLGILSGKSGLAYSMDRLIAEAIMYRYSLNRQMKH